MNPNLPTNIFNKYVPFVGLWGGETFSIYRPDYTVVDNDPGPILYTRKIRVDPTTNKFAEPPFTNVSYYDIFVKKSLLQPGDIIKKSVSDGMAPAVTVSHFFDTKAITGFRTSRIGKIVNADDGEIVYDNVYFDFLGASYPGSSINSKLEESLRIPSVKVVMFNRPNVDKLTMKLVEKDSTFARMWVIEAIDYSGNTMVLTLRSPDKFD